MQAQLEQLKKESQQRDIRLHEAEDEDSKLTKTLRQKEAELRMREDELQEKTTPIINIANGCALDRIECTSCQLRGPVQSRMVPVRCLATHSQTTDIAVRRTA